MTDSTDEREASELEMRLAWREWAALQNEGISGSALPRVREYVTGQPLEVRIASNGRKVIYAMGDGHSDPVAIDLLDVVGLSYSVELDKLAGSDGRPGLRYVGEWVGGPQ